MINVSYLPLNCESLDYSREEFVTKSSYLVVRCFQKRPKTNRPLLGTSPRLIIICSLAPTTAGMFYGISSFFFSISKLEHTLRFSEKKALFKTKRAIVKLPIRETFQQLCFKLLYYYFTFLGGGGGGWEVNFRCKNFFA